MRKQFLLGLMAVLLPLTSWAEGSIGDFKVTGITEGQQIVYGAETPTITVRYQDEMTDLSTDLYDKTYTLNGDQVNGIKDVGHYVLTIKGKSYTSKATETTVEFDVTKKVITAAVILKEGAITKTYGTEDEDVELTTEMFTTIPELVNGNTTDEQENFIQCLKLIRKDKENEGNNVGTYSVTVVGDDAAESNYMYTSTSGNYVPMEITAKEVNVTFEALTYNGKAVDLTDAEGGLLEEGAESYSFSDGDILAGDQETVKITKLTAPANTPVKAANTTGYTLTAELNNKNYVLANEGEVNLVVNKADVTITAQEEGESVKWTATYGEEVTTDLTKQFTIRELFEDEDDTDKLTMQIDANAKNAAKYDVMPYVNGTAVTLEDGKNTTAMANYNIVYSTKQQFEIEQKDLATAEDITIKVTDLTYQGKDFSVDGLLEVKEGENGLAEDAYTYTLTKTKGDGENARNAGDEFTVTIEAVKNAEGKYTGNYKNSKELAEQEIEKATLTIEPKTNAVLTKVYDGQDNRNVTDQYEFKGLVGEDEEVGYTSTGLTAMMKEVGKDVKSYLVKPFTTGSLGEGDYDTALDNYKIVYTTRHTHQYTITPATLTYWIAGTNVEYNPNKTSATKFEVETDGFVNDTDDFDEDHAPVVALAAKYEGEAKAVGEYELVITNTDDNEVTAKNYTVVHDGDRDGKFTITKRALTITALPQTVNYTQNQEADLSISPDKVDVIGGKEKATNPNVEIDGLRLGSEKVAIVAALGEKLVYVAGVNSQSVGEHDPGITFAEGTKEKVEAANGNYEITLTPGKLIVTGATEITLDATAGEGEDGEEGESKTPTVSELIAAYDGQTLEKVTIKNLKNNFLGNTEDGTNYDYEINGTISPEKWYTLVLPFDITVAELSRNFEYAIVNVPKKSNSTKNEVYFELTMQEVPANTLMAFKVAYEMKWDELEDGITFENKKIVAPTEDWEWATDLAGNEFIGVYEMTPIEGEDECFWSAKNGGPVQASKVAASFKHPVYVYPLNGYIKLGDGADATNARFYMEEANGSTTVINAITGEVINNNAEGWYSVDGMKLNAQPTQKGVYINNGKKVVIK